MGRVAVDFGVGQGAKRSADIRSDLGQASNPERFRGQNQRNPAAREAERQLAPKAFGAGCVARSFVIRQLPDGDAPHSVLAITPSAFTRDPLQYFNSLLHALRLLIS